MSAANNGQQLLLARIAGLIWEIGWPTNMEDCEAGARKILEALELPQGVQPERHLHNPDGSFLGGETTFQYSILSGTAGDLAVTLSAGVGMGVIVRVEDRSYLFRYEPMIEAAVELHLQDVAAHPPAAETPAAFETPAAKVTE